MSLALNRTHPDQVRRKGATTKQMTEAPQYAVFVWMHGDLEYPRDLARHLQRDDLEIVSPMWLDNRRWMGLRLRGVVVDHAVLLSEAQWRSLQGARAKVVTSSDRVTQSRGQG